MKIIPLKDNDIDEFHLHLERMVKVGGQDDIPAFTPLGKETTFSKEHRKTLKEGIKRSIQETDWQRVWCLMINDKIHGHLLLKGSNVKTKLHRCRLSMGIDKREYFNKGYGTELLKTSITWAQKQDSLDWIELNVFDDNMRAIRLYSHMGFEKIGIIKDDIRIENRVYNQIMMTKEL